MQTQNHEAEFAKHVWGALDALRKLWSTNGQVTTETTLTPTTTKETKKAPKPEPTEEEYEEPKAAKTKQGATNLFGDDLGGDFNLGDESETVAEDYKKTATKEQMLSALKAHSNRDAVKKLLTTKFKVKSVNDIAVTQYDAVIEAVAKLK